MYKNKTKIEFSKENGQCSDDTKNEFVVLSGKSNSFIEVLSSEQSLEKDVQPHQVLMMSGGINKPIQNNEEFCYHGNKVDSDVNKKLLLHSRCNASNSSQSCVDKDSKTNVINRDVSKNMLLDIFGSDFDFNELFSPNYVDISIEDLDLNDFDGSEVPEYKTLTVENLFEELQNMSLKVVCNDQNVDKIDAEHIMVDEKINNVLNHSMASTNNDIFDFATIVVDENLDIVPTINYVLSSNDHEMVEASIDMKKKKCNNNERKVPMKTISNILSSSEFTSKEPLLKHKCSICQKEFKFLKTFEDHIRFHNPNLEFSCETCYKMFRSLAYLKIHQSSHTKESKFVCKNCDKIFYNKYSYRKHIALHNTKSDTKCDKCSRIFANKAKYLIHMKCHSEDWCLGRGKGLKCNSCGDIKMNSEEPSNTSSSYHPCSKCGCGFYINYLLCNSIKNVNNTTRKFKSEDSQKELKNLLRYSREYHSKTIQCRICSKLLKSTSLKSHMHRKHEGTRVTCNHCNESFKNILSLREHLRKLKNDNSMLK